MEVKTNNGTFFKELNRNVKNEFNAENTRIPSIANTYINEPQFQKVQNLSRNYMRSGNAKYADPFEFHMRRNDFDYDGRKLQMLDTLKMNASTDKPDVISKYHLNVVGYY